MSNSGFLGCGDVYFNRKVGGIEQGWEPLFNATKFEIKENSTSKQRSSRSCESYGTALDDVAIKQPAELNISFDGVADPKGLALILLGDVEDVNIAASTVTGEAHTVVNSGSIIRTTKGNISSLIVNKGGTALVAGTDYEILNAKIGLIRTIKGGAIADGDDVTVDYSAGGITATRINGGTTSRVEVGLLLVGKNLATDEDATCEVWNTTLAPQSGVDVLSEDYTSGDLSGTPKLDAAKGNAYAVEMGRTFA